MPPKAIAPPTRAAVVALARGWLGTPYHHQASLAGVGVDCVGLVRGIWRSLYGREAEALPGYSRDWGEADGNETLLAVARRHLTEVAVAEARPGDVLVFRYRAGSIAKHTGILAGADAPWHGAGARLAGVTLIHAMEGAGVTEITLSAWWQRRIAAAFSFPGITD